MANNTKEIVNAQFVEVLLELPFAILLMDLDGVIIKTNKKFRDSFLYKSKANLEGNNFEKLISESSKEKFAKIMLISEDGALSFSGLPNQYLEIVDAKEKRWSIEIGSFYSDELKMHFLVGVLANEMKIFKQQKSLKRQVELKNKFKIELEQETELNDMKSRFLSIASHEFRTPLAGILSSLNLINRYLNADEQSWNKLKNKDKITNHLDKINESVKNLTTILNKFLSLSNIEKGEIPVKFIKFDLVQLLTEQVAQFQVVKKTGQTINYKHNGKVKNVVQDKHLLKNIMNNLLSNAIKFSPENSEIHLLSKTIKTKINIIVKDSGIGIPTVDQKNIFHRFFRAKNALTYQEGTGLGLNIVKQYVELMGGSISFNSEENIGTTFSVSLPNQNK